MRNHTLVSTNIYRNITGHEPAWHTEEPAQAGSFIGPGAQPPEQNTEGKEDSSNGR